MKRLLLIPIILLLTGCTVNYNIEIDDSIRENINVIGFSNFVTNDSVDSFKQISPYSEGNKYYDFDYKNNGVNNELDLIFNHDFNEYKNSILFSNCYDEAKFNVEDNILTISTSNEFYCLAGLGDLPNADVMNVSISTKYNVLNSNADSINDNIYTWIFNEKNYTNKPIYIKIEIPQMSDAKVLISNTKDMLLIFSIFIIPVVLVILFCLLKSRIKNKI